MQLKTMYIQYRRLDYLFLVFHLCLLLERKLNKLSISNSLTEFGVIYCVNMDLSFFFFEKPLIIKKIRTHIGNLRPRNKTQIFFHYVP